MDWKQYDYFMIDLDGTVYRGDELIPYADLFVNTLKASGKHCLFVTNNSTRTPEQIADQLKGYGLSIEAHDIYTSAQATAAYIRLEDESAKVLVVGEQGLYDAIQGEGLALVEENPTHVIVGLDRQFTYGKLAAASKAIRAGARFIATNTDKALITESGLTPGGGSIVASVVAASGQEPIVVGKPQGHIVELAILKMGASKAKCLMIGDNVETDIAAGIHAGVDTLLVLTGVTSREEAERSTFKPMFVWESLQI
jgi:4-nitrophenyl phosphatase